MKKIFEELGYGDRRSIGKSNEIVRVVLDKPILIGDLIDGMTSENPVLRMRCADAAEKVSAVRPELLQPFLNTLIEKISSIDQQEVRWHFAQIIPRLSLTAAERNRVVKILLGYLDDPSRIVQTFSYQALADLSEKDEVLREEFLPLLQAAQNSPVPSIRARGKKILSKLTLVKKS